jgi:hypothetical protein
LRTAFAGFFAGVSVLVSLAGFLGMMNRIDRR